MAPRSGAGRNRMSESHQKQSFLRKYIFSVDHKTIGIQFLFTTLFFFLVGGALALLLRWQLAYPGKPMPVLGQVFPESMMVGGIMLPEFYNALFTMHASVMIFFAIIPLLVGAFGNFVVPLQIGAPDMAFPRLNMLSYWFFWPSAIVALSGFFVQSGAAATGWTAYPPLSAIEGTGQTLWVVAVIMVGASSLMGAINYLTTILNMRAPGMGLFRMPMTVWAIFITSVITLLATPVLTSAMIMLLFDRTMGTHFFLSEGGGHVLLWQHLFWFYSHPAVYIMILPGMGIVSDVISTFSRKPIFGYHAMVYAIMGIAFLGFIVWGHHMFQSGMNPTVGTTFMLSTMLIAVPSAIKTFNWLGTMWRGTLRFTSAMLNAIAFVSMFVIGGLSGIFMASTAVDMYFHDTYFIVGHIHYVLFGGSMFAAFAGVYYWFPKMFGRKLNEPLGKIHFALTFIAFNCTFFPMHILGIGGHMRRIYDPMQYTHLQHLQPINVFITLSAFVLGVSQLILLVNFVKSLKWGEKVGKNPWESNTLEWQAPSPPGHGNFETTPTVYRGPYEYSEPGRSSDFHPQSEAA
ncbi:MAG: cytochrome c oxidase subunit I [Candidatus Omnitrophica bacterium CG11_big_fil_rev_8_21_14_0_20_45_26]|uniref:Cytochrome c oxidase subunit I n=1 Tax=Candidatus Abzuiibacterium crystallinum TaxID=1974748 RepID=A0A2H0LRM8_9BACT|nr:MAG: cytochrome c oxidase subunit I [Candidatus Omnitrophica bacterium CG11_big_fil_rev_8_21_14_0_20_45_26]PIW65711.1 MAG: cytochrome c oxidase subunit I [Candidatus Omnitrophica bacterium CG12_big_fil_rev_8_21_14_0_65_45_16]